MAFPPKKKKPTAGAKGSNTPIKEYPAGRETGPLQGSAPTAPAATKSTSAEGVNAPTAEPKLSPEAEAARAKQGAVTITTATGPTVAPPPDPRASYQVGEAEDNTPLVSFTSLASAAKQKGNPSALVQPAANSDLKGTAPEDGAEEDDVDEEEPVDEEDDSDEEDVPVKGKKPFKK